MSRVRALLLAFVLALGCRAGTIQGDWLVVRRDDLVLGADVTGTLRAVNTKMMLPPPVPGVWDYKISFMAEEGVEVKTGDVVITFDKTDLERRLIEKQNERDLAARQLEKRVSDAALAERDEKARLAESEASLRKAELMADRPADLTATLELRFSELDLELAKKQVAYARSRIALLEQKAGAEIAIFRDTQKRAEQRVDEIETYIKQMTVRAPRDGTIIHFTDHHGEKKKVGDSVWRAGNVLEICSLDRMEADADVDEMDASKLEVGQPATLELDAHPDDRIHGRIASIQTTVQKQSPRLPRKVIRVKIAFDQPKNLRLRPGMRFHGSIETGRVPRALVAPAEAIVVTPSGPVVKRRTARGTETVNVLLGKRNAREVEIKSGLGEGDRIARADTGAEGS